jgi:hypothetical protein
MAKDRIDPSTVEFVPVTSLDDLDDYAKDEVFPFKGVNWTIPSISQKTADTMSAMHGDMKRAVEEEDVEAAARFDITYVHTAMSANMTEEEAQALLEELNDWPKRVLGRISRFIASTMMGPIEETIPEEKKEEAKK